MPNPLRNDSRATISQVVAVMAFGDFELLSFPPKSKPTLYETGSGWLTQSSRQLLTRRHLFRALETATGWLTDAREKWEVWVLETRLSMLGTRQ